MASASTAKLHAALQSVAKATASLEQAAAKAGQQQHQKWVELETTISATAADNDFLKSDNVRLSNQLQSLQQEYLSLQEAASTTVERLDASVKHIDRMLEH